MLLQRARGLYLPLQKWGCYLFSLLFYVVKYRNVVLDVEAINHLYDVFLKKGYIDEECTVLRVDDIFAYFGMRAHIRRDFPNAHHAPADYEPADNELEVLYWEWTEHQSKTWGHFTPACPGRSYDPYGVSRCVNLGHLVSKRIIVLEAA